MRYNTTLKVLYLDHNHIESVKEIAKLGQNSWISELCVSGDAIAQEIAPLLEENRLTTAEQVESSISGCLQECCVIS